MLNIIGPVNTLGYGYTTLGVLKGLSKIGCPAALWPISSPSVEAEEDATIVNAAIDESKFYNADAPCVRIWHQNALDQFVGRGPRIGFPIFELDEFTPVERHHLSNVDELFVCSQWASDIVNRKTGMLSYNIHVVPLGVDRDIFTPSPNLSGPTRFFNCGKWEIRKGHDVLIKAFNKAFSKDDYVELWMMCDNPFLDKAEAKRWESLYAGDSRIRLLPRVRTHQEVYNVMKQVDCGVFPARAEGWNLEALEILACGKRLIITDYSAHKEYCTKENSMLIEVNGMERAYDNKWFFGQGSWAKIDDSTIDQMVDHMRSVHAEKQANGVLQNRISSQISESVDKFTWENTAKEMVKCLNI